MSLKNCKHCGTPYASSVSSTEFCCSGCEYVYRLIEDRGLSKFYDLKPETLPPVRSMMFQERDYSWLTSQLEKAQKQQTEGARDVTLLLDLQGISCIGCVWLIEKLFQERIGASRIEINLQLGQIQLTFNPASFDIIAFAQEIQRFGYVFSPAGQRKAQESRKLTGRIGLCAAFALNSMLFTIPSYLGLKSGETLSSFFDWLVLLFATLSVLTGGSYFFTRAFSALKRKIIHIDLPIALGVIIAYVGSLAGWLLNNKSLIYLDFVSIFIFLMLIGRWFQEWTIERNRNHSADQNPQPDDVVLLNEALEVESRMPIDQVRNGTRFLLPVGAINPVCAELLSADATLSLEWINGESDIQQWKRGRRLPSGVRNVGTKALKLQAREPWADSLLSRLLARSTRGFRSERLEQILKYYLIAVCLIAIDGGIVWWWLSGSWQMAFQVTLSVLVVSCPCALGISWPLANELALIRLRTKGLFVREETLFARLAKIKTIVFDKTGTLTLEMPKLENKRALDQLNDFDAQILLNMVDGSLHPISRALREHLLLRFPEGIQEQKLQLEEVPGWGVKAAHFKGMYSLGRPDWLGRSKESAEGDWRHDCEFAFAGQVIARFKFSEALRPDARLTIQSLATRFKIFILSGDRYEKVHKLVQDLNLPASSGLWGMKPDEKAVWLEQNNPESILFVGDGANDSLAFEVAGCRGTPVVEKGILEPKSDFYFISKGLGVIQSLFSIQQQLDRTHRNAFAFAILYNVIVVIVSLSGMMNPLIAAVLMPLSSILTVLIALRGMRNTEK
jgi:Cu2+-exporting ATPase